MGQFQKSRIRALAPQLLDHTIADATTAVNRQARRFVHDQQRVVLPHYRQRTPGRNRHSLARFGKAQRRDAYLVADLQAVGLGHPATVDPQLPAAQDAVDVALWHALQAAHEVIVDALPGRPFVDSFIPDRDRFAQVHNPAIYFCADRRRSWSTRARAEWPGNANTQSPFESSRVVIGATPPWKKGCDGTANEQSYLT